MGLNITAFRRIQKVSDGASGEEPPAFYHFLARLNEDFPGRADEIQDWAFYIAKESFGFRAGSYVAYNNWRDALARLAGYPAASVNPYSCGDIKMRHDRGAWNADSGPFWELINFSDREGVIGASVSAKLASDFAAFQEKADAHHDGHFCEKYADWRKAFEIAADGGAVCFH